MPRTTKTADLTDTGNQPPDVPSEASADVQAAANDPRQRGAAPPDQNNPQAAQGAYAPGAPPPPGRPTASAADVVRQAEERRTALEQEIGALERRKGEVLAELDEARQHSVQTKEAELAALEHRIRLARTEHQKVEKAAPKDEGVRKARVLTGATAEELQDRLTELRKERFFDLTEDEIEAELVRRGVTFDPNPSPAGK